MLGAGLPKIASILDCSVAEAKVAETNFLHSLPELRRVKKDRVPIDARRGYFIGVDGRKVACDSEHLMLAGYLQNGEVVAMKTATVIWYNKAKKEGIDFKLVDFVHDEWQTEVKTYEEAERIGELQCEALREAGEDLGLFCPLDGSSTIDINWRETH